MLCVIPFFNGDVRLARNLLQWIAQLGGCKNHDCLLVSDFAVPWNSGKEMRDLAAPSFKSVRCVSNPQTVKGWIPGSVSLFWVALNAAQGTPFLWLEPDAVPVKPGWLDDLELEYLTGSKLFVGALVTHDNPNFPNPYLEGCAIYPKNALELMREYWKPDFSWTRTCAPVVVPNAYDSPLFHHLWGERDNPPTFGEKRITGTNVFGLEDIKPSSVLFHRCKDGSLIRILRQKLGIKPERVPIVPFFSFCSKDMRLMAKSLAWLNFMHPKLRRTCVLHFDSLVRGPSLDAIRESARKAFQNVIESIYPAPQPPFLGWPGACNWAFRQACVFERYQIKAPWFWFEADCVATRPDWLIRLEGEYALGQQPFMGCIIGGMGHANGTMVYPHDAPAYAPSIMTCVSAWDTTIRPEIAALTHRGNDLIQHCREMSKGECHDCHGRPPVFRTKEDLRAVHPTTCVFHPCKDGSLIDRLREVSR